jgi:deazaflavin-dependent oxidoreductase (nitroreductase family)
MAQVKDNPEEKWRHGFKMFNHFMLLMWRLGWGPWVNYFPQITGRVMVITHTGRKTGKRRRTPVTYADVDGDLYCTAGFGPGSDWYRNVMSNPQVEIWLPDSWWAGIVEEVVDPQQCMIYLRQIMLNSGQVAPLAGVNPHTMSDDELGKATANYRVLRIRRTAARTGPGGPGDLVLIWPILVMILLPFVFWRRKR